MTDKTDLLPMPEGKATGMYRAWSYDQMRDYARANVAHAVAPLQAEIERLRAEVERLAARLAAAQQPAESEEPLTDTYVQTVPDKCDRIVWRGSYYHLPLRAVAQEAVGDWVLVPRTPTDAMLRAAQSAWLNDPLRSTTTMWRAMLEAAPQQPAGVEEMQRRLDREESDHGRAIDQRDAAIDAAMRKENSND